MVNKWKSWPDWLKWAAGLASILLAAFITFVGHAASQTPQHGRDIAQLRADVQEVNSKADSNREYTHAVDRRLEGIDAKLDILIEMAKGRAE